MLYPQRTRTPEHHRFVQWRVNCSSPLISKSLRSASLIVCQEGFVEQIAEGTAEGIAKREGPEGFAEMEVAPATKGSEGSAMREVPLNAAESGWRPSAGNMGLAERCNC